MTRNEGMIDRTVRVIVGLALIGFAFGIYGPEYTSAWGWVGLVPLVTGLIGWCPAYSACGLKGRTP